MMEKDYIQKLLDSYMAAETSRKEEKLLSHYFSNHRDIPPEWRDYSVMFRSLNHYRQKSGSSHRRTMLKWSAVAAIITVLLVVGLLLPVQKETDKPSSDTAQTAASHTTNVLESEPESKVEKHQATAKSLTSQGKKVQLVRRTHKATIQVNHAEHLPDVSLPVQNPISTKASIQNHSSHRKSKPSEAIAQIAATPTTGVLESQIEVKNEESPTIVKPQTSNNKQEQLVRQAHKAVAQVSQAEPHPDMTLSVQNSISVDASILSLTSHRDRMRSNIQAAFESNTIFTAQNSIEL